MQFGKQGNTELSSRLGVEVKHRLSDSVEINASTAWKHQLNDQTNQVTGRLQILDLGTVSAKPSQNKDSLEFSVGGKWQAKETLSLQGQLFGSSNSDQTRLGVRIALSKSF